MARLLVSVIAFTVRILRAAFRSRADLAEVDEHTGYCENGHRGKVAPGSIPSPLGYDLAAAAFRSTSN